MTRPGQGMDPASGVDCIASISSGRLAKTIQELARHENFLTNQHYMHLSPKTVESAIRLLDGPLDRCGQWRADGNEAGSSELILC